MKKEEFAKQLTNFIYSPRLADRFVRDYDMPFPITFKAECFGYYLALFNDTCDSLSKYTELCNEVKERFDGDAEAFLEDFYDTREKIIEAMHQNEAAKKFNEMDMSVFELKDKPSVSNSGIYNCENVGKYFISIDLKKANFSALKYVDKNIVLNADTYEEFVGKFTESDYFKNSKHARQVIFGQLNPKRHITVEKYLINEIRKRIDETAINAKLVSMVTDELIYEVSEITDETKKEIKKYLKGVQNSIEKEMGIEVSMDIFKLTGYNFILESTGKIIKTFFQKESFVKKDKKLKCVPLPYSCIVQKLLYDTEPEDIDRHFTYEGMDATLNEDYKLEEIK